MIALLVISLLVLLLLRHYLPLRSTPAYLTIPVFLALALPSSIILLVPIDLASNAVEEDGVARGIWLQDRAMLVMWRIAYWLTFMLTWYDNHGKAHSCVASTLTLPYYRFVLPLLGDYVDSGHREPRDRLIYSFRSNLRYQLIILTCAAGALTYYIISEGFSFTNIKGTVMALAYAWGLILAIYLMGHGLVALPRRIYRSASVGGRLRRLQSQAPAANERMTEALEELNQLELQVLQLRQRKTGTARDFQDWIADLAESSEMPSTHTHRSPATPINNAIVPAVITERYLVDLSRKLKRARHKRIRFTSEWHRLVRSATSAQAILDAAPSQRLTFPTPHSTSSPTRLSLTPFTRYHLHGTLIPALFLLISLILSLASLTIIFSETLKPLLPARASPIPLTIIHHPSSTHRGKIGFPGQIIAGSWLCYMCATALTSIREVRIWGNRALVARGTYPESATWYATQVAKLTVPLAYNFVTFFPGEVFEETAFYKFLGHLVVLTPLGRGFSSWFPVLILVPVGATLFGVYGRVGRWFGFGVMEDEDGGDNPWGSGGWREGKALIERERFGAGSLAAAAGGGGGVAAGDEEESVGLTSREPPAAPRDLPFSDAEPVEDPSDQQNRVPPAPRPKPLPRPPAPPSEAQARQQRPRREEEEEESNFFTDFAHRLRNTLDTVDKPDFPALNIKKPKWLGGGGGEGGQNSRGPLDRLFGGREADGRVRL